MLSIIWQEKKIVFPSILVSFLVTGYFLSQDISYYNTKAIIGRTQPSVNSLLEVQIDDLALTPIPPVVLPFLPPSNNEPKNLLFQIYLDNLTAPKTAEDFLRSIHTKGHLEIAAYSFQNRLTVVEDSNSRLVKLVFSWGPRGELQKTLTEYLKFTDLRAKKQALDQLQMTIDLKKQELVATLAAFEKIKDFQKRGDLRSLKERLAALTNYKLPDIQSFSLYELELPPSEVSLGFKANPYLILFLSLLLGCGIGLFITILRRGPLKF